MARAPTARAPTTRAPTARAPTARAPTARAPTARAPTARAPTARAPTTRSPTARAPTARACASSAGRPNCANLVSSFDETSTVRLSPGSARETTARAGCSCQLLHSSTHRMITDGDDTFASTSACTSAA
eukprot:5645238-Prymnesium_polylepis.1